MSGHVDAVVPGAPVLGVLAVVQDMGLPGPARHHGVLVAQRAHLLTALRDLPPALSPDQVAALGRRLDRQLAPHVSSRRAAACHRPTRGRGGARRRTRSGGLRLLLLRLVVIAAALLLLPKAAPLVGGLVAAQLMRSVAHP